MSDSELTHNNSSRSFKAPSSRKDIPNGGGSKPQLSSQPSTRKSVRSMLLRSSTSSRIAPSDSLSNSQSFSKSSKYQTNPNTTSIGGATETISKSTRNKASINSFAFKANKANFWDEEEIKEDVNNNNNTGNLENPTVLHDWIDKYLMFIQAVKLENPMHHLLSLSLHIFFIVQTLVLGVSLDFGWGEYGKYILNVIVLPRTFGFQYLPYEAYIGLAAALLLLESIALSIIYLTYRSLVYGTSYWKRIRSAGRIAFASITIFSMPITFALMHGFFDCDYEKTVTLSGSYDATYVLRRFPTVECLGVSNIVLGIVSWIFCFIQILITMNTIMLFCDTDVKVKSFFVMDSPFLLAFIIGSNQLYNVVAGTIPNMINYIRPILYIIIALGFLILLFKDLPFFNRSANSIYGGVGFARLGIGIASIVTTLVNRNDSWDIGLGLTFGPIVLGSLGFVIGFIVTDIYTRRIMRKGQNIASIVTSSNSVHELNTNHANLPSLAHFIKFALKGTEEQKDILFDFVRLLFKSTDSISFNCLINMVLYSKDICNPPNYFQASTFIRRADQRKSGFLQQYNIIMRTAELEKSLAANMKINGSISDSVIERLNTRMKKLRVMIIEFWKCVSSKHNVDHILRKIESLSYELDVAFENLIVEHDDDETIQELYNNYQIEFNFMAMGEFGGGDGEKANTSENEPPKMLSLSHTKYNLFNNDDLLVDNFDSVSVANSGDDDFETVLDKQQEIFSNAIGKPDEDMKLFYFLNTSGGFQILFIVMVLSIGLSLVMELNSLDFFDSVSVLTALPFSAIINISNLNGQVGPLNTTSVHSVPTFRKNLYKLAYNKADKLEKLKELFTTQYDTTVAEFYNLEDKPILLDNSITMRKNTSTNWIAKRTKAVLLTLVGLINDTQSTESILLDNPQFEFVRNNVEAMSFGFSDFFDDVYYYLYSKLLQTNNNFIIIVVFIFFSFFVFSFIHTLFLLRFVYQRRLILRLFHQVPKEETRLLITTMEKVVGEDREAKTSKKSLFTSVTKLIFLDLFSILVTCGALALIIVDVFTDFNHHTVGVVKLREMSLAMGYEQQIRYDIFQMVLNLNNQTFREERSKTLLDHVAKFDSHWTATRYGSSLDNYYSLSGVNSNLDNLLGTTSDNCTSFSCQSMDFKVAFFRGQAVNQNQILKSYNGTISDLVKIPEFFYLTTYDLYGTFGSLNEILYYAYFNSQPYFTLIGTLVGIPLLLFCYWANFMTMKDIRSENLVLRRMLNYLHWEVLDSNDDLRNYIFYHILKTDPKKKSNRKVPRERAILEAALVSAVVCSANGTIEIFNNASEKLFGYRSDQMIGFPLAKLFDKNSEAILQPILTQMGMSSSGYSETLELVGVRKNLSTVSVEMRACVSTTDNRNIITFFIRDLTEIKVQVKELAEQKKKSESLLMNIMPYSVAKRLQEGGENLIADKFDYVTCIFTDIVGLLDLGLSATELVQNLNNLVMQFDEACVKFNLEKIKTIQSKYFCTGGLKSNEMKDEDHEMRVFEFALNLFEIFNDFQKQNEYRNWNIGLRAGINSGPLVAGVCGVLKYAYDIWGDAVNTASRMEYLCPTGHIQVTGVVYSKLKEKYSAFEEQQIEVKGKGTMQTYVIDPQDCISFSRSTSRNGNSLRDSEQSLPNVLN